SALQKRAPHKSAAFDVASQHKCPRLLSFFWLGCLSLCRPADSVPAVGYASRAKAESGRTPGPAEGEDNMLIDLMGWVVVGAVAGWLAGLIVKGYGFGLLGNIIVGVIGGLIAGWLLPKLGILNIGGIIGAIIYAVIGAVILLLLIGLIKR